MSDKLIEAKVACAGITWFAPEEHRVGTKIQKIEVQKTANFGQTVELPKSEYERLIEGGYIIDGAEELKPTPSYSTPMTSPAPEVGGTSVPIDPDDPDAEGNGSGEGEPDNDSGSGTEGNGAPPESEVKSDATVEDVIKVIADGDLNAGATVALAGGDKEVAAVVLAAEKAGADRSTVTGPLEKLIAEGDEPKSDQ